MLFEGMINIFAFLFAFERKNCKNFFLRRTITEDNSNYYCLLGSTSHICDAVRLL
jgi:hypothetical protein